MSSEKVSVQYSYHTSLHLTGLHPFTVQRKVAKGKEKMNDTPSSCKDANRTNDKGIKEGKGGKALPPSTSAAGHRSHDANGTRTQSRAAVPKPSDDLLHSVRGMYRILDLINEQGSGGLGEALT